MEFQSTERRPCWCSKTYPVRVDLFSYVIKHFFLFQYMCRCSGHVNARKRALNCPITLLFCVINLIKISKMYTARGKNIKHHFVPSFPVIYSAQLPITRIFFNFPWRFDLQGVNCSLFSALNNRVKGVWENLDRGLYTRPRAAFSSTDRLTSITRIFIIWQIGKTTRLM